ncbi:MAG: dethiobiotin synthase, partial [Thiomonas sp.]
MTTAITRRGCFVTGTDTGVGKTAISATLLHWFGLQGWRSAGLKPVACGMEQIHGRWANTDVLALQRASSLPLREDEVGPCQFNAACAPHIAAQLEGRSIDVAPLLAAAHTLAGRADALVVEGVGGFAVPLNAQHDTADLAQALGLPVVLVVGLRLGCLNHALLTAQSIQARGLRLAGWVANTVDSAMPWLGDNVATLREWLGRRYGAVELGYVPRLDEAQPERVLPHLRD